MNTEIISYAEFTKRTGIKITQKHTGKMTGMQSLSTSCLLNKYCQERAKVAGSICSHCYAQRMMNQYGEKFQNCFENNMIELSKLIDMKDLPNLNVQYFRFEAFGDFDNENQLINYFNICKKNPKTKFALWTKNPWIVEEVLNKGETKPKNLNIVLSSLEMNEVTDFSQYEWADRVFTVYDKNYIKDHDVEINCGGRSCMSCLKCYRKSNKTFYINEKLK